MGKKNKLQYAGKKALIDATAKSELTVVVDELELSMEVYEKELKRLRESMEQIRQSQFALNAAVERVQSRRLKDIFQARINQLVKQRVITNSKK